MHLLWDNQVQYSCMKKKKMYIFCSNFHKFFYVSNYLNYFVNENKHEY